MIVIGKSESTQRLTESSRVEFRVHECLCYLSVFPFVEKEFVFSRMTLHTLPSGIRPNSLPLLHPNALSCSPSQRRRYFLSLFRSFSRNLAKTQATDGTPNLIPSPMTVHLRPFVCCDPNNKSTLNQEQTLESFTEQWLDLKCDC